MDDIILGGRRFKVIDFDRRTVMNDHYLMRVMRLTTADKVTPDEGETQAGYLLRIQTVLLDSGYVPDLLGGYLLPTDKTEADWTVKMARETSAFVAKLNTQEDRERVIELALEVAFGFFRQGLAWLKSFLNSSQKAGTSPEPEGARADA